MSGDEERLSFAEMLHTLRRHLWAVALMVLVFPGVAVGLSLLQTPQYEASTKIFVGQKQGATSEYNLGGDVQGLQQLVGTLATAVETRPVAEAVIEDLNLKITPEALLEEHLSAQQVPDQLLIQVNYRATDAQEARAGANAVGEVFSKQVSEVSENVGGVTATVFEPAALPGGPVSPNPLRNALLALALGVVFGVGLAFLLEYLDDSWQSPGQVEQFSGVPTLGVIPENKILKARK